jgi:hypothetical protein
MIPDLKSLLKKIQWINQEMLERNFMLTTSISFGRFKYQDRIVIPGMVKNAIYGGAYVATVLDSENGDSKIQPGECRFVEDSESSYFDIFNNAENREALPLIQKKAGDKSHYYYYWHRQSADQIKKFEEDYKDSKYRGMLTVLKENDS